MQFKLPDRSHLIANFQDYLFVFVVVIVTAVLYLFIYLFIILNLFIVDVKMAIVPKN